MTDTLTKFEQEQVHVNSLMDEEPMEQQSNDEPSFSEVEKEQSPQEPKECVLSMISTSPQHTPSSSKISFLPSILAYRDVPYFVDSLETRPLILFKPTYFVTGLPTVVDYTTFNGRKPLFEHFTLE